MGSPIYTQLEGGILALLTRESAGKRHRIPAACQGRTGKYRGDPGLAHDPEHVVQHPARPCRQTPADGGGPHRRIVYRAEHNEEGGRFWRKSNENIIAFLDDELVIPCSAGPALSQIKELALMDNVLSPFVKTILLPP
jgi:dTDP-4-dehydro-6-deoxy-alpha-D-glucopyranose 2,3-dehydratase